MSWPTQLAIDFVSFVNRNTLPQCDACGSKNTGRLPIAGYGWVLDCADCRALGPMRESFKLRGMLNVWTIVRVDEAKLGRN